VQEICMLRSMSGEGKRIADATPRLSSTLPERFTGFAIARERTFVRDRLTFFAPGGKP
jgi:hypothetical protein